MSQFHDKNFENILSDWVVFRNNLSLQKNPIEVTIDFYKDVWLQSSQIDPWKPETWPTPWELFYNNRFCQFSLLLIIFYTFILGSLPYDKYVLLIVKKGNLPMSYCLVINDIKIGYNDNKLSILSQSDFNEIHIIHSFDLTQFKFFTSLKE